MAVLGLAFARAFSSYGKWGLLLVEMCRLLSLLASLLAERGLKDRWARLPISSYSLIIIYIQLKCIFSQIILYFLGISTFFFFFGLTPKHAGS